MTDFKDYYGKVIQLNDRVIFADKDTIKEGEVTEIFGNCLFVKAMMDITEVSDVLIKLLN